MVSRGFFLAFEVLSSFIFLVLLAFNCGFKVDF